MPKYSVTERKEFLSALKGTKIGQDLLKSGERAAFRPMRSGLSANWQQDYQLFNLVVDKTGYTLTNKTDYEPDMGNIKKQVEWLNAFSGKNTTEKGNGVKRVAVVICEDGDELSNDTFTNGWKPVQNQKKKDANNKLAYFIEYEDGTNSGWLLWDDYTDAERAVWCADFPLDSLAEVSDYRGDAWAARERCIAAKRQQQA